MAGVRPHLKTYLRQRRQQRGHLRGRKVLPANQDVGNARLTNCLQQQVLPRVDALDLIASGLANGAIARRLDLAPKTVGNHISGIFAKVRVANQAQAIIRARDPGLVVTPRVRGIPCPSQAPSFGGSVVGLAHASALSVPEDAAAGLLPSFGTDDDTLDNTMMDSFWSSMQPEPLKRKKSYLTVRPPNRVRVRDSGASPGLWGSAPGVASANEKQAPLIHRLQHFLRPGVARDPCTCICDRPIGYAASVRARFPGMVDRLVVRHDRTECLPASKEALGRLVARCAKRRHDAPRG